ncbi:HD-GYP domain-containing protein [Brevibacillus marinus]|uniref:HD-GYP domain-containing protein n=1 Tax=Brevibacillus marinus TaxID=2496837 RepID=UPI000F847297|nr:HD-GYP domain-containing protein [Brevibacillus marinus]
MLPGIKLPQALQRFIVRVCYPVLAVLLIVTAIPTWESRTSWNTLVFYTILSLVVSFLAIKTPNVVITLNNAVTFSAILLYGTWAGVWCATIESLIIAFLFRSGVSKILANAGQLLSTVWIVGWTHEWLLRTALPPVLADLLLGLLYFAVNTLLCSLGIAYFSKLRTWTVAKSLVKSGTCTYVLVMVLGGIGARLMESHGIASLLPVLVMFLAMRIIFQQYFHNLNRLQQKMDEVRRLNDTILAAMAASIDARDPYTHGHSYRVAYWGRELARALGLAKKEADEVYYGGILHDIGKIGIEDNILKKEGKLSREEYHKIKQHPVIGYHIVKQAGVFPELLPAIRHHHERYDGKGYPDGLSGQEIPLIARILALSDAFDAMVSDRPYRKGVPVEHALQIIRDNAGTQFDQALAEIFVRLVRSYSKEQLEEVFRQSGQTNVKLSEGAS